MSVATAVLEHQFAPVVRGAASIARHRLLLFDLARSEFHCISVARGCTAPGAHAT
jgi:hypothetical protein